MATPSEFKKELQEAVNRRHQANHPLIDKWARGEAKREAVAGAIAEHWHWLTKLLPGGFFNICAKAPQDVIDMEMENWAEETDPKNPHVKLIERFAEACGMPVATLEASRGLPTTEAWAQWELSVTRDQPWIAGVAAVHVSSEAQEPKLFSRVLPALREKYKFNEYQLEYWWLHAEADIEHGGRAFEILAKHCTTREQQDLAIHWAGEGARMKYLFWDGINLHYEMGYRLQ